jgi:hypothetical protein
MRDMKEGREFWTGLTRFTGFLKGTDFDRRNMRNRREKIPTGRQERR